MAIPPPAFPQNSIFPDLFAKLSQQGVITQDPSFLDEKTPNDVIVTTEAREPAWDPTLGIVVPHPSACAALAHRLVTLGDSLTHGFQSGAIFNTDLSYPAIIAHELGCYDSFRHPRYNGYGGLPLNIEYLLRNLEHRFGSEIS